RDHGLRPGTRAEERTLELHLVRDDLMGQVLIVGELAYEREERRHVFASRHPQLETPRRIARHSTGHVRFAVARTVRSLQEPGSGSSRAGRSAPIMVPS